jgi:ribulose-phosphate 3-epimerase
MNNIKISPSILSADFANLERDIKKIEEGGADFIHVDIMDGHFVPNITFGPQQVAAIKKVSTLPLDVHLMISDPQKYIPAFIKAGSDYLTIHYESSPHVHCCLDNIRKLGAKPGITICPGTPVEVLEPVMDMVDLILIMSVNPGFGGQSFVPSSVDRIKKVAELRGERDILIEVDGGIKDTTAKAAIDAGADILVAGSYIYSGEPAERIKILKNI